MNPKKPKSFYRLPFLIQIFMPFFLASLVLFVSAKIFYLEGRRESLAAKIESALIVETLKKTVPAVKNRRSVAVVSVKDSEISLLLRAPQPLLVDAHISEYARVLDSILKSNPKFVVVSWLGSAHPNTEEYLRPLLDVIDKHKKRDAVLLSIPFSITGKPPENLTSKYLFSESADCFYRINAFCTYRRDLGVTVRELVDRFWTPVPRHHVSLNLPHVFPNFLMNVPDPKDIMSFQFLDVKDQLHADFPSDAIVFIGNDAKQDLLFRDNQTLIQRSYLPSSKPMRSLIVDGVPWHVQWAAMTQMFVDRNTVAVVPPNLHIFVVILTCIIIVITMWFYRGLAFGSFLFGCALLPLGNVAGVSLFRVYVPVVDTIFWGLLVFVSAAFLSISYNVVAERRVRAVRRRHVLDHDLRTNFISIISHNLNTPVAQMRGLLDVMVESVGLKKFRNPIEQARIVVERINIAVKYVLAHAALQNTEAFNTAATIKSILEEFDRSWRFSLRRLHSPYRAISIECAEDILYEKLTGDAKHHGQFIQGCILLIVRAFSFSSVEKNLKLKISMEEGWIKYYLEAELDENLGDLDESRFLRSVILKFLLLMTSFAKGRLELDGDPDYRRVLVRWRMNSEI